MTFGERLFDVRLRRLQPVQCLVEFVGVDFTKTEQGAERVRGGGIAELTRGGELGGRFDDPGNDHGRDQPRLTVGASGQDPLEANLAQCAECGRDVAIRQGALDLEALGHRRPHRLVGKNPAQGVDLGLRPSGQVGQGAALDLALFAIALAQQHGGRGVPVGDGRDVHPAIDS